MGRDAIQMKVADWNIFMRNKYAFAIIDEAGSQTYWVQKDSCGHIKEDQNKINFS